MTRSRLGVVLLVWVFGQSAEACSCLQPTHCELLAREVVFLGEVVEGGIGSILEDPWYSKARRAKLRVIERFRGVPADQDYVELKLTPTLGIVRAESVPPWRPVSCRCQSIRRRTVRWRLLFRGRSGNGA